MLLQNSMGLPYISYIYASSDVHSFVHSSILVLHIVESSWEGGAHIQWLCHRLQLNENNFKVTPFIQHLSPLQ